MDESEETTARDRRMLAAAWLLEALLPGKGFTIRSTNARRMVRIIARHTLSLGDHEPVWLAHHPDGKDTGLYMVECTACEWRSPDPLPFLAAHEGYNLHCVAPVSDGATLEHFLDSAMVSDFDVRMDRRFLWGDDDPPNGAEGNLKGLFGEPGITPVEESHPWTRRQRFARWAADVAFCTSCLRFRCSPGHLMLCDDRRKTHR